jgi:hypothetical protein
VVRPLEQGGRVQQRLLISIASSPELS